MKIAIVGGSPSSEHLAPFNDPEWKIWVLGIRADKYKRADKIFEIHEYIHKNPEHKAYCEALVKTGIPLVVSESFPLRGHNVNPFPFEEARSFFNGDYLTSSAAYMMALAILEGATTIGIYGMDMAYSTEYFDQRPCMEAWIGLARGKGIEVIIPDESPLGKCNQIYGIDLPDEGIFSEAEFKAMAGIHAANIVRLQNTIRNCEMDINAQSGAQQTFERLAELSRSLRAGQDIKKLKDVFLAKEKA